MMDVCRALLARLRRLEGPWWSAALLVGAAVALLSLTGMPTAVAQQDTGADVAGVEADTAGGDTETAGGANSQQQHSLEELKKGSDTSIVNRMLSFLGIFFLLGVAWPMSENRWEVDWELVAWGVGLQLTFAGLIFLDPWGQQALCLGMFVAWALAGDDLDTLSAIGVGVAGGVMLNPWVQPMVAGAADGFLTAPGLGIYAVFFAILGAFLVARDTSPRLVAVGIGLQILFAVLLYFGVSVQQMFDFAGAAVGKLLEFTDAGSRFLFKSNISQEWSPALKNFAFQILPTIIFFSTLMTILYYLGVMQWIVRMCARMMRKTMGISGAESLSASANIFVGQTEAPLVIKPYVEDMTKSELMVVMTGGFATVAGGVMAIYVGMLSPTFPEIAKHLIAASVMSAPAALVVAKIVFPETKVPETKDDVEVEFETKDANTLDAASRGASEGLDLALNVGAMLLAFLALVELANFLIGWPFLWWNRGQLQELVAFYQANELAIPEGCSPDHIRDNAEKLSACVARMAGAEGAPQLYAMPAVTLERLLGWVFSPFALAMGVPWEDCLKVGGLLGQKMVINELVAYAALADMLGDPSIQLNHRSIVIATYALCGFANFGSIGIQLGGIGGIAPSRKSDLAQIALKAMIGGTLAAMMTATVAGILV